MRTIIPFTSTAQNSRTSDNGGTAEGGISEDLLARFDRLQQLEKAYKEGILDDLSPGNVRDIADALYNGRSEDALRIVESARLVADGLFSCNGGALVQPSFLQRSIFRYHSQRPSQRAELALVSRAAMVDNAAKALARPGRKTLEKSCELLSCREHQFSIVSGRLELGAAEFVEPTGYDEIMLVLFVGTISVRSQSGEVLATAMAEAHCCTVINIQPGSFGQSSISLQNDGDESVSALWVGAKGSRLADAPNIDVSAPIRIAELEDGQSLVSGLETVPCEHSAHENAEKIGSFSRYALKWEISSGSMKSAPSLLTNPDSVPSSSAESLLVGHAALEAVIMLRGCFKARGVDRPMEEVGDHRETVTVPLSFEHLLVADAEPFVEELLTATADRDPFSCDVLLLDSIKGHDIVTLPDMPSLALHKIFNLPVYPVKKASTPRTAEVVSIAERRG
jgi:hypothetical protein